MITTSLLISVLTLAFAALPPKMTLEKPKKVLIAVIDTGVDVRHRQLQKALWQNPGESGIDRRGFDKATNGRDDDGNGFIDDVYGWNFLENNNRVEDLHGHGTHVAGIIAGGKNIQIISLRALDTRLSGQKVVQATVSAIHYAIKMKVKIINYSGGGSEPNPLEKQAIQLAEKEGILFVAAAGNGHTNSDINNFFPADYGLSNIISVAAVDQQGRLLPSSNFGVQTVSVAALGKEIESTLPDNKFGRMSGTSQATAQITRILASMVVQSPSPFASLLQMGKRQKNLVGKLKNPVIISDGFKEAANK
jgi:subtilisin family serine protease